MRKTPAKPNITDIALARVYFSLRKILEKRPANIIAVKYMEMASPMLIFLTHQIFRVYPKPWLIDRNATKGFLGKLMRDVPLKREAGRSNKTPQDPLMMTNCPGLMA